MGRVTLMSKIISIPSENFLYCDTDSMIFKGNIMPDINIGKELGDWSIEKEHVKVNVVGAKTYQEQEQIKIGTNVHLDIVETKCGGLPRAVKDNLKWLELKDGMKVHCQKPKRDSETWAINILDTEFTVSTRANAFRRS